MDTYLLHRAQALLWPRGKYGSDIGSLVRALPDREQALSIDVVLGALVELASSEAAELDAMRDAIHEEYQDDMSDLESRAEKAESERSYARRELENARSEARGEAEELEELRDEISDALTELALLVTPRTELPDVREIGTSIDDNVAYIRRRIFEMQAQARPVTHTLDPWEYDAEERAAIEHEPASRWVRLRRPIIGLESA